MKSHPLDIGSLRNHLDRPHAKLESLMVASFFLALTCNLLSAMHTLSEQRVQLAKHARAPITQYASSNDLALEALYPR